jgi:hypothetical protein
MTVVSHTTDLTDLTDKNDTNDTANSNTMPHGSVRLDRRGRCRGSPWGG